MGTEGGVSRSLAMDFGQRDEGGHEPTMVVAGNAYDGCLVHVAQTWYRCVWGTISIGCWILNA